MFNEFNEFEKHRYRLQVENEKVLVSLKHTDNSFKCRRTVSAHYVTKH